MCIYTYIKDSIQTEPFFFLLIYQMPPFHEEQHVFRRAMHSNHSELSRTQYKLQLQRLSFLTNDKNYLDHPQNMKRLTKELDRVNREYRNVRRYQDPVKESFKRLVEHRSDLESSNELDPSTSSSSSSSSINDSIYSTSAEKSNFLSRWFQNSNEAPILSTTQPFDNSNDTSVIYSSHPTIANHINKRRTARY
jgi:hypothetical protein